MGTENSTRRPPGPAGPAVEPVRDGGPAEAAHYIGDALADLARLAQRHRLEMLTYLLDMAQLEAREIVRLKAPQK